MNINNDVHINKTNSLFKQDKTKQYQFQLIIDTAATGHYLITDHIHLLKSIYTTPSLYVRLPDGSRILSSHSGDIQIFKDKLPRSATKSYIFPDLKQSLISVPLLCDTGCIAIFSKKLSSNYT